MPSSFSPFIVIFYLAIVLAAQTVADVYFTQPILPASTRKRSLVLLVANVTGMLITALVFRLLLPFNHMYLLYSRDKGTMALAVLVVILEYFPWALPYVLIRGWIVREWLMGGEIREKRQAWWSYVMIGSVIAVVLIGPLYLAVTIVQPLMTGVNEVFAN
ncbi:MAG: hypothetical protein V2A56_10140 [bacterium]